MKHVRQNLLSILAILAMGFFTSCSSDDNDAITVDPTDPTDPTEDDPFDARLNNNATDSLTATVFLSDVDDNVIDVLLSFTSDESMKRVYITQNIQGQGDEKVDAAVVFGVDAKPDGSIDLSGDLQDAFNFDLKFSTTDLPDEGTVVYKFWSTSGRGDYRDDTKRNLLGPATLTIDLAGTNPAAVLKEYTSVIKLEAPTADGKSSTFISTLDGEIYEINEGEEFAAFWDFGFYYLNSTGVSLASSAAYPNLFKDPEDPAAEGETSLPLVNVNTFLGIEATEINNTYFVMAPADTDFDSFSVVDDLTFTIANTDEEDINELAIDDVVYILDQYGKKGVLKVTDLVESFGSDGFIEFDLKMEQ
ncbi:MAG: hypothetical protein ABJP45_18545 [Cyclobacteriaceae bacterium]